MALTISNETRRVIGDVVMITADATFDSSYDTGGEPIAASDFAGLNEIIFIIVGAPPANATQTTAVNWDRSAGTLYASELDVAEAPDLTEIDSTADLSTVTVGLLVFGK